MREKTWEFERIPRDRERKNLCLYPREIVKWRTVLAQGADIPMVKMNSRRNLDENEVV